MLALYSCVMLAAAGAPGAPVLLEFSSASCRPCRAMEPVVRRLIDAGYPVRQINVEEQPALAAKFNIRGVPSFVLVSGNREIQRITGATSYERLAQLFPAADGEIVRGQSPDGAASASAPPAANPPVTAGKNPAALSPAQLALQATVRLKVEESQSFGFGSGTIIDAHNDPKFGYEALIVTCGHLFRESKGKGKISVDLFAPSAVGPMEGQLITYDLERDIALVSIRPSQQLTPVRVAPGGYVIRPQDRVFSIGCDQGAKPTVRESQVNQVGRYQGTPNVTVAGQPVVGRSGGGLFSADGLLIGVCYGADPQDNEGVFAGLPSVHWQLDQIGQQQIYQASGGAPSRVAPLELAAQPAAVAVSTPPSGPADRLDAPPDLAARMPGGAVSPTAETSAELAAATGESPAVNLPAEQSRLAPGDDTEVVVILRSKSNPERQSEVYVVDRAPPELVQRLTAAARQSGEERFAAQTKAASQDRVARRGAPAGQQIIRGQQR